MSDGSEKTGMFAVSHLRFTWMWVSFGVLLACSVMVLSLVNLAPIEGVLLQDKLMHVLAYGLLMGWFAQIYRRLGARLILALVLIAMGVGVEYMQGMVGYRQFDRVDMAANTSGVLLAWLLSYSFLGRVLEGVEKLVTLQWGVSPVNK